MLYFVCFRESPIWSIYRFWFENETVCRFERRIASSIPSRENKRGQTGKTLNYHPRCVCLTLCVVMRLNLFCSIMQTQQSEMILTVETRLNQIREYIRTTLLMMESLKQSSDPVSTYTIWIFKPTYGYSKSPSLNYSKIQLHIIIISFREQKLSTKN